MSISIQISKHFSELYFGGNWTCTSLKDVVSDISILEAIHEIEGFNSIGKLIYHIHYFARVVTPVLSGGVLEGNDKFSFDLSKLETETEWQEFKNQLFTEAKTLVDLIKKVPDEKLLEIFVDEKYGNFYRNFHGLIEHGHYHLGQIVILKKLIRAKS